VALALLVPTLLVAVQAQPSDREREQLQRLRLQVQQLQQQLQAAQDQVVAAQLAGTRAQADIEAARSAQAAERGRLAAQGRRAAELERELATLRAERDAQALERQRLSDELLVARDESVRRRRAWRTTEAALLDTQAELRRSTQRAEADNSALAQCRADNAVLVKLGDDLVQRLLGTSLWDRAKVSEPLLQLGRVQLENLGQRYGEQVRAADQTRLATPAIATTAPTPATRP
jgi:hypothetical protein